ncbi:glutamate 5-kinase [Hydrogenobacter thermophilus]|uniref:glutamate 5-kinase n=1 Tax=Hydrogenobacter thermophilus TaxID=940 RepID=UPI0030F76D1E
MRVLIKIGSNLIQTQDGDIDLSFLSKLAREIKTIKRDGGEVLLVSSGAVLCGAKKLGIKEKPKQLVLKQALAGVGQAYLMHVYDVVFSNYGLIPAQVLLTSDVFKEKAKFYNSKNSIEEMLKLGVVPVINENDTVAVSELVFGDNDFLAVHTAFMMDAELLVFLSTAGGLRDHEDKIVSYIEDVDKAFSFIKSISSEFGTGGMFSKLFATKLALSLGMHVIITGKEDSLLDIIHLKTSGTYFKPSPKPLKHRKKVIAMMEEPKGIIYIDEGAYRALKEGKSLLPAGIVKVEGMFGKGDTVSIYLQDGYLVGKGKVNFSSNELLRVLRKKGEEVKDILKTTKEEAVHRDNLVIF